ncbi:MAG: hypothetical protein FWF52_08025 [Candidatus Azobacteroides sp.]|nr:hypothetical protein [Candidatus Azobacteroides sp.]
MVECRGSAARGCLNVVVGEYGSLYSDQLWLHGKYGIYFTQWDGTPWPITIDK